MVYESHSQLFADHPLRVARVRAGLTVQQLADLSGVSRGTINALEKGRIKVPRQEIVDVLATRNRVRPEWLRERCDNWTYKHQVGTEENLRTLAESLSGKARAVLSMHPDMINRYSSFAQWRRDIEPQAGRFASLLGLSTSTLRRFERFEIPMPKPLEKALAQGLKVQPDYMEALKRINTPRPLPVQEEVSA
jgi:transcriptional regulator with XRE-family HTH domain